MLFGCVFFFLCSSLRLCVFLSFFSPMLALLLSLIANTNPNFDGVPCSNATQACFDDTDCCDMLMCYESTACIHES